MFRIIVCCKPVPEWKREAGEENEIIMNPGDLAAVEAALRMEGKKRVEVLSMSQKRSENILRRMYGMGVDEITVLCDPRFAGSDTYATSYILSSYIKRAADCSLILCGNESLDGGTGHICPGIGEHLGIPHITDILKLLWISNTHLYALRRMGEETVECRCRLPAVVSVLPNVYQESLPVIGKMSDSLEKEIKFLGSHDLGLPPDRCGGRGSYTKVLDVEKVQNQKKAMFINGDDETKTEFLIRQIEKVMGRGI